jgi:hypothetical protein
MGNQKIKLGALRKLLPTTSPLHDLDMARGMLIACIVGVASGLGAVVFRHLIGWIHQISFEGGKEVFASLWIPGKPVFPGDRRAGRSLRAGGNGRSIRLCRPRPHHRIRAYVESSG